jgi:hypothetical protein
MGLSDPQVTHESGEVFVMGVWGWGYIGLSEAPQVITHDLVVAAKCGYLVIPHPAVGNAGVDKDERVALSGNVICESRAVDFCDS